MAEAGKKSSTDIWLSDAKRLVAEGHGGASQLAEKLLRDAGDAGRLTWGYRQKKGDVADDEFWGRFVTINFEENLAVCPSYRVYFIGGGAPIGPDGPTEWLGVWVLRAHVLALLPDEISPLRAASSEPKRRQVDRVRRALRELYPPDGRPPDEILIKTLHGQVEAHLKTESKNLGLPDPSPTSVARAAGRRSK